ncbi:hypothetical protein DYB28_007670 [Aphanomyces astaci]|uniref:Uncharacterized protein n=1 Tax=Aphanomyces astaci TaxID=112090 RepID=A0A9X8E8E8_APHAT|nr:hypothetical protein DYB28_007670 [Aphanomyces astaci]
MYRNVADRSDKLRQQARGRSDRKSQVKFVVFRSAILFSSDRVTTDHMMKTQQLVPPHEVTVHHAHRLKMYHEGGREVTDALEAQITIGDDGFHVVLLDKRDAWMINTKVW